MAPEKDPIPNLAIVCVLPGQGPGLVSGPASRPSVTKAFLMSYPRNGAL